MEKCWICEREIQSYQEKDFLIYIMREKKSHKGCKKIYVKKNRFASFIYAVILFVSICMMIYYDYNENLKIIMPIIGAIIFVLNFLFLFLYTLRNKKIVKKLNHENDYIIKDVLEKDKKIKDLENEIEKNKKKNDNNK